MTLTEKRDVLLMSMDILKHNELLGGLNECKLLLCSKFTDVVVVVVVVFFWVFVKYGEFVSVRSSK